MSELPTSISSENDSIRFGEINRLFSETEYGQRLKENVRYDRYKPEGVSNEEWEKLLGADVNNFKHLRLTYGLARNFLDYPSAGPDTEFSEQEKEDILLTAIVHDWAEAVTTDKPYDLKTKKDEEDELSAFKEMLKDGFKDKENAFVFPRIQQVLENVISDQTSKLGKAFNAIERAGYLRTGLRAWEVRNQPNEELQNGLQWLTNNVLTNQIPKMIEYSKTYPAIKDQLSENQAVITEILDNLPENVFENYKPEERDIKKKQFAEAKEKWEAFVSQNRR